MQTEIADALGASQAAVSQWLAAARDQGVEGLASRTHHGRPPKLTSEQLRLIPEFLWHGAEAYGFRSELWTCRRVAQVIGEELKVHFHPGHVARLLRQLRWSPQLPVTRAVQRDEEAIKAWRKTVWPRLKDEARDERRRLLFVDESGLYLLPGVVRTYAPMGATPSFAPARLANTSRSSEL